MQLIVESGTENEIIEYMPITMFKNAARVCPIATFLKMRPLDLAYSPICKDYIGVNWF